jgi:hypothetical protein
LGAGKGNGGGMGRGRSVYKQPGTRVEEDRTTQKGGIQVSKRDSVTKGVIKESLQGEITGGCAMCFVLSSCIYVSCMLLCEYG